ncbi:uncharacterized protein LOC143854851 [Tasmannia lanceolata]|uniref:uncharacterized protein LOC143854851 n=1 Tax=Tasmannia lanceolata TaxID=3420 RepID=UPI004063D24D
MGNYISCALSTTTSRHSTITKVIFPSGEVRPFDHPINAAELMLEVPHHFLVNSSSLQIGRRFPALSADEDLEMGNVYVMFPMRRVNSVITAADMGVLFMMTTSSALRRVAEVKRILPDSGVSAETDSVTNWRESDAPRLNLDDIEDDSVNEFKARLSMCRSRKPMLETIKEETVCLR